MQYGTKVHYCSVSYGLIPVLFKTVSNTPDLTEVVILVTIVFVATTGSESQLQS